MGKMKHRLKGSKGKRWAKGQSSSSNPSMSKHRDAAKSRFFQANLGLSNLTTDALRKHNAFSFDSKKTNDMELEEEDAQSFNASTFKTFDTFASNWSSCSNVSFSKLINNFRSDSAVHKEMLAILAAVTEVIKDQGGKESNTEYFGALMTTLSDIDLEETATAAVLNLLGMGIKAVPQGVLQSRFSQCSKLFLDLLAKYAEVENNVIMKGLFGCLSVLLRAQELAVWKEPYTRNVLQSMLVFTIHTKPKVRKAAQHAITAVLKGSSIMIGDNPPPHHPAAGTISDFCVEQMQKHGVVTTVLHILGLLREILATFPKNQLKKTCEAILNVMLSLHNVLINSCGLQALHGLFASRPSSSMLPSELNAKLIAMLYDLQPSAMDTQPTQAWLAVMQEAFINLNKLDPEQSITHVPRIFILLTTLWMCGKPEVVSAVTLTMRALVEEVVGPASGKPQHKVAVTKVIVTVQAGLTYQYHSAWTHVLHVIGVIFKTCGENCVELLIPCLKSLGELRDSHQFCFTNELDFTVGQAVRTMGPEVVIKAIPLQLRGIADSAQEFKRSWILPILKENIQKSTLKCFAENFKPLIDICEKQAAKLSAENNQVAALSYNLLHSQLWALLPSFCSQPSDIADYFGKIAQPLGILLRDQKDQRLTVMSALRKLINYSTDNKRDQDAAKLSTFAKNYLHILFNLYTTPGEGSDEEGIRLAALETVKVYLSIASGELLKELFKNVLGKLDSFDKDKTFLRESLLDLLRALAIYQPLENIECLYNRTAARLKDTKDHKEQKKYYRILEELCTSDTDGSRKFVDKHLSEIQIILLDSLSTSAPSSKGPRLRCLLLLLDHARTATKDLMTAIVPEAVLCCRDINARCRQTAYELLHKMADKMSERGELEGYLEMVMAGLAGSPQLASATLLALAAITHHTRENGIDSLVQLILSNVCILCCSASREIVGSALSYFKVFITSMDTEVVTPSVPNIVKALVSMTDDCKRHFRTKTRDILARLVRWYGADSVLALVPESETVMRLRLRNMRKIQERKKRQRQQKRNGEQDVSDEEDTFSVKRKPKSIDEILANLDESDMEMDEMVADKPKAKSKKKNNDVWLREEAEDIVDFTDISTNKKISATKPSEGQGVFINQAATNKKKSSAFKLAPDGRMIIKDDSDSDNDVPSRKTAHVPGLSDSDDENDGDLDEARSTVSSVKTGRKRQLSVSTAASQSTSKYRGGGVGIHRTIKKIKPAPKSATGAEYKSKKAGGDMKKKGLPDPYSYIPLRKDNLNRRKRAKAIGQLNNILKGAKKGANIGSKNKIKLKKRKRLCT